MLATFLMVVVSCAGLGVSAYNSKRDQYCGLFKEDAPGGGKDNFSISRLKNGLYKCVFHGVYAAYVGENTGDAECTGKIESDLGVFKQDDWKAGALYVLFRGGRALLVQQGDESDCGFGHNVNATGIYDRVTREDKKPKSQLAASRLVGEHFEKSDGSVAFAGTFDSASPFREEVAIVFSHKKAGVIDLTGKLVVPYKFKEAHDFYEGLAAVTLDGKKWGYIDKKGNLAIKPIYDYAWDFAEGTAVVASGKDFFWIDKSGAKIINQNSDRAVAFSEGLGSFEKNDLWGVVDRNGREIAPARYGAPLVYKEGLAVFQNSFGHNGFLDKNGQEVIAAYDQANSFSEGLAAVQTKSVWGFIDNKDMKVIPDQYSEVFTSFVGGRCFVRKKDSPYISIIDKTGKELKRMPLQCRSICDGGTGISESTVICHNLDFEWDLSGHYQPADLDGNLLQAFARKNVKFWKSDGLFVVSGPSPSTKMSSIR